MINSKFKSQNENGNPFLTFYFLIFTYPFCENYFLKKNCKTKNTSMLTTISKM